MRDVQPGGSASRGPNPDPGGEQTPGGLVPPYEGRSTGFGEDDIGKKLEESVDRMYAGTEGGGAGQTASPAQESPVRAEEVTSDVTRLAQGRRPQPVARWRTGRSRTTARSLAAPTPATNTRRSAPPASPTRRDVTGVDPQDG